MPTISLLAPIFYNVKQYGALGDGVTNDTTAIQNTINAAAGGVVNGTNTAGGVVYLPPGVYVHSGLVLYNCIHLLGAGMDASILYLANGSNTHSISGYNTSSLIGGSTTGGIYDWSVRNLTINGNKSNQSTTGMGIRVYGKDAILEGLRIWNTYSDGIRMDWNGTGTSYSGHGMEVQVSNCKVHDTGGAGVNWTGPFSSQFTNVICYLTGSVGFYFGPHATGIQCSNCHAKNVGAAPAFLIEGTGATFTNCIAEGSPSMQLVLLANNVSWRGGSIASEGVSSNNVGGAQIGQQAGLTPYAYSSFQSAGLTTAVAVTGCCIESLFLSCEGSNGSCFLANDGGDNSIRGPVVLSGANSSLVFTGTLATSSLLHLMVGGAVAADGTGGKGGWFHVANNAIKAFTITDTGTELFNLDTWNWKFELPNAVKFRQYSDAYGTRTLELSGGTILYGESGSAPALATSGTITTSGVGVARVAPTGNVTAVILQAGTQVSQQIIVRNESAFTIAFAASGTSHVADGATLAIPANTQRLFTWSTSTSLWYRGA